MKIQCACGAKYAFDATPEMLQNPVKFVCPSCGLDSSDYVNELVRREFAGQTPTVPPPAPAAPATKSPRLKISLAGSPPSAPVEEATTSPAAEEHCAKHPRELAVNHCLVCGKPMCPQCMKLFGHVCSPLCRAKAEAQNINVPVYAGQSAVAEARYWRKAGAIGGLIAAVIFAALGFWTWYAWFGSVPRPVFSIRFDDIAYAGESELCGTNQIVFLHGGTLARCDIKSKKEIWSDELVTKQQIAVAVARVNQSQPTDKFGQRIPQSQIEESVTRELQGGLQLHASGQNVWVSKPGRLTHFDWDTGKVLQEIPLANRAGDFIAGNDEFLIIGAGANGQALVTHINPASGESRVEEIGQPGLTAVTNRDGQRRHRADDRPSVGAGNGPHEPGEGGGAGAKLEHARTACPARAAGQQLGAGTHSGGDK